MSNIASTFSKTASNPPQSRHICLSRKSWTSPWQVPFSLFTWYLAPAHADSASCLCTQVTGPNEDVLKDNYSVHGYVWHVQMKVTVRSPVVGVYLWPRQEEPLQNIGHCSVVSSSHNLEVAATRTVFRRDHAKYPQFIAGPAPSLIL